MEDISLHILDIAENSINAGASWIKISVSKDTDQDRLFVEVMDNGKGMNKETIKKCLDPFFTTQKKGFGLGISLFSQAAEEAGGKLSLYSENNKGTRVCAEFKLNSIDRKPLGDMASTIVTLIVSKPDIDFRLELKTNSFFYDFDTVKWKEILDDVPINTIDILNLIKSDIKEAQESFERA